MQFYDNDPFGNAIKAHLSGRENLNIKVFSDIAEDDVIPVPYLFRTYEEMPLVEQRALDLCRGTVLDIGGGAGPHALILQDKGMQVSAIDSSKGCVETMQMRGVKSVQHADIFDLKDVQYDTLLMLMNGIGISGSLHGLDDFLQHVKTLLKPKGQLLVDSSDLIYLFDDEQPDDYYYGEINYQMEFEGALTDWFGWLYIHYDLLRERALENGFQTELMVEGPNHDYLAKLTPA